MSYVSAREVIPGAVWAFNLPIRPGRTGHVCPHCGDWHWGVSLRPPGWRPGPETVFQDWALAKPYIEFPRCNR